MFRLLPVLLGFFLCAFSSCIRNSMYDSKQFDSFTIHRFDRSLYEYGISGSFASLKSINTDFALEKRILVEDVLKIGSVTDSEIDAALYRVLSDTSMLVLMTDCSDEFKDVSKIEHRLESYFKRMKNYLPNIVIPSVYAQFSGLGESVVVKDSLIGICLDKYLGSSYPPYRKYFTEAERYTMCSSKIETDCLFYYILSTLKVSRDSVLDRVFSIGKAAYMTCLISENSLEKAFDMTEENRQWLIKNRNDLLGLLAFSPEAFELSEQMREASFNGYQVLPTLIYPLIKNLMENMAITCEDLLNMDGKTIMNIVNRKND